MKSRIFPAILGLLVFLTLGCRSLELQLLPASELDELPSERLQLPPKIRVSGFHEDESLVSECAEGRIASVEFFTNAPIRIRCQEGSASTEPIRNPTEKE